MPALSTSRPKNLGCGPFHVCPYERTEAEDFPPVNQKKKLPRHPWLQPAGTQKASIVSVRGLAPGTVFTMMRTFAFKIAAMFVDDLFFSWDRVCQFQLSLWKSKAVEVSLVPAQGMGIPALVVSAEQQGRQRAEVEGRMSYAPCFVGVSIMMATQPFNVRGAQRLILYPSVRMMGCAKA